MHMTGTLSAVLWAVLAFVGGHFVLSAPALRDRLIAMLGARAFAAVYSLLMILALIWVVAAYRVAPPRIVWDFGPWINWVPLVVMPFAMMLAVLGSIARNPTAMMGEAFLDSKGAPVRGPATITRHPFLNAAALWALSHLIANGDAASIILFGGMALLAIGGMYAIDHKRALKLGATWRAFAAQTSRLPFAAAWQGRTQVDWKGIGWSRPALGIVLYVLLVMFHDRLFGVPAWVAG
jgi:uncharacterized membrane protein